MNICEGYFTITMQMTESNPSHMHHKQGKMPTYSNFSTFDKDEETLKRLGRYHTMSTIGHDWTKPFKGSPKDIGFHRSLITLEGIEVNALLFHF